MKAVVLLNLLISLHSVFCRDFYMGVFRRNDYLVAQDNLFKEKKLYTSIQAEYGRLFKCPITYFRVVDRLGIGPGPKLKILRGGLRKKYIAVRIKSGYNLPISVNIYVGCENRKPRTPNRPWKATTPASDAANNTAGEGGEEGKKGDAEKPENDATSPPKGGDPEKPEPGGEKEEPEAVTEPPANK